MIFGEFPCAAAEGVTLAHTLNLGRKTLKKGHVLTAADIALLTAAGIDHVWGARLEADELDEDAGAGAVAALLTGAHTVTRRPYTGRCNVHATVRGVLRVEAATIDALNALDEAVAIGTLPDHALVRSGQVVATVKIIPFAVKRTLIERCRALVAARPPLRIAPLRPRRAALILGELPGMAEKVLQGTVGATRHRLEALGSRLALVLRCRHVRDEYVRRLAEARAAGCDLLLVAGATVTKDRADTVPAAVVAAGGTIDCFGMPVEPGNMLLLAHLGGAPVIVLPGCARSRRTNGLDWVLARLLADLPLGRAEIARMGVGGLIRSPLEPEDEETEVPQQRPAAATGPHVAALVLAAGCSRRMGGENKLLAEVGGVPLVLRAVNAALASQAASVTVVLGHEAERIGALLAGRPLRWVYNPDYASGLSSSLRAGLAALPEAAEAVVVMLADMPYVSAAHIDRLISAFDPRQPAIIVPQRAGRRGNPILWPRALFAAMQTLSGDEGARGLLAAHADRIHFLDMDDGAIHLDIDTPQDLEEVRR